MSAYIVSHVAASRVARHPSHLPPHSAATQSIPCKLHAPSDLQVLFILETTGYLPALTDVSTSLQSAQLELANCECSQRQRAQDGGAGGRAARAADGRASSGQRLRPPGSEFDGMVLRCCACMQTGPAARCAAPDLSKQAAGVLCAVRHMSTTGNQYRLHPSHGPWRPQTSAWVTRMY